MNTRCHGLAINDFVGLNLVYIVQSLMSNFRQHRDLLDQSTKLGTVIP